jgi:hypothetical protein
MSCAHPATFIGLPVTELNELATLLGGALPPASRQRPGTERGLFARGATADVLRLGLAASFGDGGFGLKARVCGFEFLYDATSADGAGHGLRLRWRSHSQEMWPIRIRCPSPRAKAQSRATLTSAILRRQLPGPTGAEGK